MRLRYVFTDISDNELTVELIDPGQYRGRGVVIDGTLLNPYDLRKLIDLVERFAAPKEDQ